MSRPFSRLGGTHSIPPWREDESADGEVMFGLRTSANQTDVSMKGRAFGGATGFWQA
jgi:hypothetical protein